MVFIGGFKENRLLSYFVCSFVLFVLRISCFVEMYVNSRLFVNVLQRWCYVMVVWLRWCGLLVILFYEEENIAVEIST